MNKLFFQNKYIVEVKINKKLKHTYISIDRDKKIIIKTSNRSEYFIYTLLEKRTLWIEKHLKHADDLVKIDDKELYSIEFIQDRIKKYSKIMNLDYSQLKFRKMKRRWGSCNSNKIITLNKSLTRVDKNLIDYVVVHELAHLKYMNHSREFHKLVEFYLPNANIYKKELNNIRLT